MTTTYPYGYGTGKLTLASLDAKYGPRMHPEYRRRLFAWIEDQRGSIGIGSAWRPTPSNTSAASRAGHSFHQDQTFTDGFRGIAAVDLVHVNPGHVHRAPNWSEVPAQGSDQAVRCGLHANVSNEPWHLQPVELDSWQTWNSHGRPAPRSGHPLRGHPATGGLPAFDPIHGRWSLYPLNQHKPAIDVGSHGDLVRYCQGVIRLHGGHGALPIDGNYGHVTMAAVEDVQRFFHLVIDGQCGPRTWPVIDFMATA